MGLQKKLFLTFVFITVLAIGLRYVFSESVFYQDLAVIKTFIKELAQKKEISSASSKEIISQLNLLEKDLFFQTLAISLIVLGIALLLFWSLIRSIVKPLHLLVEASYKIAEGKFEEIQLPPKTGNDEVNQLSRSFEFMIEGLKEREKIRDVLDKVVSKDVAEEILSSKIQLGGEDRIATMLFSDIRGFTHMVEHMSPQKIIHFLNTYMTKMTRIAEGEGGVIDKYVGDEIMVLYGVPVVYQDHALRALSTAMIMMETLKKWNGERAAQREAPIEIGIGIHSGLVVAGNIGAIDRLNYTVVGANVNLCSRLCQAAAPMQILISEYTLKEPFVEDSFFVEKLDPITVKGFSEPVNIYTIVGFKWQ